MFECSDFYHDACGCLALAEDRLRGETEQQDARIAELKALLRDIWVFCTPAVQSRIDAALGDK